MPALFRRSRHDEEDDVVAHSAQLSVAALVADHLEAGSDEEGLSHREFREFVRDRARSQDEVMSALRTAARTNTHR